MAAAAFDGAAARAFGTVAGPLRTAGRKKGARVSEVLIEATAIANGLPWFTCGAGRDFPRLVGRAVICWKC
jgi:tRNA(fMet)-specific endonuclease VapC